MSEERKLKGDLLSSGRGVLTTRSSALVRRGLEALRSQSVAQESLITLVKRIQSAVVTVIAYDDKGEMRQQGSGFFVTKAGHLLTSRHVLYGASQAEVKTHDGKGYAVTRVLAEDKEGDLVRVVADITEDTVQELQISGVVPEVGERVVVVSGPLGMEQTLSDGLVSAVRDIPWFGNIVQLTAALSPGSSGSPVVNLKEEVIGIAALPLVQRQNLNFVVPGACALALKAEQGWTLAEWTDGVTEEWAATAEGLYFTGLRFVWGKDYANALPYFAEAAQRNPRYAEAWFGVGFCNGWLRRYAYVVAALQQAIHLKPDDAGAHHGLGVAYSHLGRWYEAVAAYQQAIRLKPDYTGAHHGLGVAYGKLGNWHEAVAAYQQAIRLKPNYAAVHSSLGAAYGDLGRYQDAVAAYQQAIRLKPDYAGAHHGLGWAHGKLGRYQDAVTAFQQAILLQPEDAKVYYNLGAAYHNLGRYQDAVAAYQQALRLKPDYAAAHLNLGATYSQLGRYQEAVEAYQQALRLKPDDALAHYNLGRVYLLLGNRGSAREEYKILKTLDQNLAKRLFSLIH